MQTAYSYRRFSDAGKQSSGTSIERQTQMARAYCDRHGLTLSDLTYEDLGVSAFTGENASAGALAAFKDAIGEGDDKPVKAGSALLVESFDRLSRQGWRPTLRIVEDIIAKGVSVITLTDGRIYDNVTLDSIEAGIILMLTATRAAEESATKSRRIGEAWKIRKANAIANGYVIGELCPGWMSYDKATKTFALIPPRAAVVRRMVDLALTGVGLHSIARDLNRSQAETFEGAKQWFNDGVRRVLGNAAVAGVLAVGNDRRPGYFPAVATEDEWQDVQTLWDGRRKPHHRVGAEIVNPLAGLACCSICGGSVTRTFKGPRQKAGKAKLICQAAKTGKAEHAYWSCDLEAVVDQVRNALPQILAEAPTGDEKADREISRLRIELDGADTEIERLVDALRLQGRSPAIGEALGVLESEKRATEAKLAEAVQRASYAAHGAILRRQEELAEALDDPQTTAGDLNVKLRAVFERVAVDAKAGRATLYWKDGEEAARVVFQMTEGA